jgi:hypothetical protein
VLTLFFAACPSPPPLLVPPPQVVNGVPILSAHSVLVGGVACAAVTWESDSVLTCRLAGEFVVGTYPVVAVVAGRAAPAAPSAQLLLTCPPDMYGASNETCRACPEGGRCLGGAAEPAALAGYFPAGRGAFVRCDPPEACLGGPNGTCSRLYSGDRCGACSTGAYRCGPVARLRVGTSYVLHCELLLCCDLVLQCGLLLCCELVLHCELVRDCELVQHCELSLYCELFCCGLCLVVPCCAVTRCAPSHVNAAAAAAVAAAGCDSSASHVQTPRGSCFCCSRWASSAWWACQCTSARSA